MSCGGNKTYHLAIKKLNDVYYCVPKTNIYNYTEIYTICYTIQLVSSYIRMSHKNNANYLDFSLHHNQLRYQG